LVEESSGAGSPYTAVAKDRSGSLPFDHPDAQPQLSKRLLIVNDNATNRKNFDIARAVLGMIACAARIPALRLWSGFSQKSHFEFCGHADDGWFNLSGRNPQAANSMGALGNVNTLWAGKRWVTLLLTSTAAFLNKPVKQSRLYNVLLKCWGQPLKTRESGLSHPQIDPQFCGFP